MGNDVVLVKKLREETGAGILACQKAIESANGDYEAAVDFLKKQGIAKANTKIDRKTSEGLCCIMSDKNSVTVVKLCCETDFVAKNQKFNDLILKVTKIAFESKSKTVEDFLKQSVDGGTVNDLIVNAISVIGENITVSDVFTYSLKENEKVVYYVHNKVGTNCGRIVSLTVSKCSSDVACDDLLKKINMHIVAMKPMVLSEDQMPADVVSREKEVYKCQVYRPNMPETMVQKIVEGKMKKFFEENVLLNQMFVLDNKKAVAEVISDFNKENNSDLEIVFFKMFSI